MRSTLLPTLALAVILGSAACGGPAPRAAEPAADADEVPTTDAGTAMCAPDVVDCVDVVVEEPGGEPDALPAGDAIMAPDIPVVEALQQQPQLVSPEPGTTDGSFPIFLQEATVDGASLEVAFSGGRAPCFVIESVEAIERDDAVIVTVRAGATSGTDQATCTTVVEMQYVEIELADALGTRALLDGSRLAPGEVRY